MDNGKNKKTVTIMIIISLIIIILGIACGAAVYFEISDYVAKTDSGIYIDGADFSGLIFILGQMGSVILGAVIVIVSFFIVMFQWLVYFIVKFIKNKIIKKNQPQMYVHKDNMI